MMHNFDLIADFRKVGEFLGPVYMEVGDHR